MAKSNPIAPPTLRVIAPKAKMTIYFALLIIAFVAMLFACLFLYLEIRRFGGFGAVSGRVSAAESRFDRVPQLAAKHRTSPLSVSTACHT
jgi:uncharacterized membrane protein